MIMLTVMMMVMMMMVMVMVVMIMMINQASNNWPTNKLYHKF